MNIIKRYFKVQYKGMACLVKSGLHNEWEDEQGEYEFVTAAWTRMKLLIEDGFIARVVERELLEYELEANTEGKIKRKV